MNRTAHRLHHTTFLGSLLIGSYAPGNSLLHRTPLWGKSSLCACLLLALAVTGWEVALYVLFFCFILSWSAGMRIRTLLKIVYTLRWLIILLGLYYLFWGTWQNAVDVMCTMLDAVLISRILLTTTPLPLLLDGIIWLLTPLKLLGLSPKRIGLMLALVIRSIPAIMDNWGALQHAAHARGLPKHSAWRLLVPLVVQTVGYAQITGDVLTARGLEL